MFYILLWLVSATIRPFFVSYSPTCTIVFFLSSIHRSNDLRVTLPPPPPIYRNHHIPTSPPTHSLSHIPAPSKSSCKLSILSPTFDQYVQAINDIAKTTENLYVTAKIVVINQFTNILLSKISIRVITLKVDATSIPLTYSTLSTTISNTSTTHTTP